MADTTISVGSPSVAKLLVDLGDGSYADAVVLSAVSAEDEAVAASGSVAAGQTLFARVDCSDKPYTALDWRLKCDKACTYQLYKTHELVDPVTLAALSRDGAAVSGNAADTTTAGLHVRQWVDGYPYCYLGITNNDSTNAATVAVGATRIR